MDKTREDETLNQWLRDAHGMESQAEQMLEAQHSRLNNYPELAQGLKRHAEETRSQRARLETCMTRRGATPSALKDLMGQATATMQAMGGAFASDEVVKGAIAGYTFENFEIACYTMLVAAADQAGDFETKSVCEEILREKQAMSDWMKARLPDLARTYMVREMADSGAAKR